MAEQGMRGLVTGHTVLDIQWIDDCIEPWPSTVAVFLCICI